MKVCDKKKNVPFCPYVAVRDLRHFAGVFEGSPVRGLQAPFRQNLTPGQENNITCFAHILRNVGFGNRDELRSLSLAWRSLFELIKPDMVLFDHSPTALLAAKAFSFKRVLTGVGFANPPPTSPLVILRPWMNPSPESIEADERTVLGNANNILEAWGIKPMRHLFELYHPSDGMILTTIKELDPFAPRPDVQYAGVLSVPGRPAPQWPTGEGCRIFAYLKPFPALNSLLAALRESRRPTVIVISGMQPQIKATFEGPTIRFEEELVDMRQAVEHCDLAILNSGNAATTIALQAGKPALHIPLVLEQVYNARAAQVLGAGIAVSPTQPQEIRTKLFELLQDDRCAVAARAWMLNQRAPTDAASSAFDRLLQLLKTSP